MRNQLFAVLSLLSLALPEILLADATTGERNLVRDDFLSDNCGGFVGWSTGSRGLVRSLVKPIDERSPNGKRAIRIQAEDLFDNTGHDGIEVMPAFPLKLKEGAKYRFSAYVRTHGLTEKDRGLLIFHARPWDKTSVPCRLPFDTHGMWELISGEATFKSSWGRPDGFLSIYISHALAKGAYIDFAEPKLFGPTLTNDPKDDLWTLKPFVRRVSPITPLLDRIRAADARMTFYYPGDLSENGERLAVRAAFAGRTAQVTLGDDHRASVSWGTVPVGPSTVTAELVGITSGTVYSHHEYRARARADVQSPTPLKRLNNFVNSIYELPLKDGDYAFTLAEETWVYLGFSQAIEGASATVDGHEGIVYRPGERSETMRFLDPGHHVVHIAGVPSQANAQFAARTVKTMLRQALHLTRPKTKNFDGYVYGQEFWRKAGMLTGFNTTSIIYSWPERDATVAAMIREVEKRGVKVEYGYGMGSTDKRRQHFDSYFNAVTNNSAYQANRLLQYDENAMGASAGLAVKAYTTEIWWRAYDAHRHLNVFLDDGGSGLYANPTYDIPELAAYLNTGDGHGLLYAEAYFRSVQSRAELDRLIDFLKVQFAALRYTNPIAPTRYSYLLCGWMMSGAWSPWYNTDLDMRAMISEVVRALATDPAFADCGGLTFSFPQCWDDFWRFVSGNLIRYYCIEGGTGDFAAMNGMKLFPGHIQNGDFLRDFANWTVEPAETNSIRMGYLKGFGQTQGRVYDARYRATNKILAGEKFAELVRSAKAPNIVRQKIVGLEPGRVYQLVYTAHDLESAKIFGAAKTRAERLASKPLRPVVLEATVKGGDIITDLCHTIVNHGKYGNGFNRTSRIVFRATSPTAEAVFSDWKTPEAPKADIGAHTVFNYVMVHPYFYESEEQLEILKSLFRESHR